jgi:hypothetical protein
LESFSRLPRAVQWTVALLLAAVCLGSVAACYALVFWDWRWIPVAVAAVFLLVPLESLLVTPLYFLVGRFRYLSPMLLATRRAGGGLDLHVGTLFDYVLRLRWSDRGPRAARIVTADVLRGLLALAEQVERGEMAPDAELVATSYFFSDRTVARLGFELREVPAAVRHNLVMASVGIALRLSFTRGRPAFPDLRRIRQAATTAGRLAEHSGEIRRLLRRLPSGAMG